MKPDPAWRWESGHLARRTCQDKWVRVCEVLATWPIASNPEAIKMSDGSERWALKTKVPLHDPWHGDVRRTKPSWTCDECRGHARAIAALWRGLRPPATKEAEP